MPHKRASGFAAALFGGAISTACAQLLLASACADVKNGKAASTRMPEAVATNNGSVQGSGLQTH